MTPKDQENEPNENNVDNLKMTTSASDSANDNLFQSPGVTLRRNFKFDDELLGNNGNETNKFYQRNKPVTNSVPASPSRPNSVVSNRGISRIYSVSGNSDVSTPNTPTRKKIVSKNGNLVLQVVLPPGLHRSATNPESVFPYSASPNDAFMDQNDMFRVRPLEREMSVVSTQTKKYGSEHSTNLPPSTPKQKNHMLRSGLSTVLSITYAIFLVIASSIIYLYDVFEDLSPLYEILTFYLILGSGGFLIFTMIDIKIYENTKKKFFEFQRKEDVNEVQLQEFPEGSIHFTVPLPEKSMFSKLPSHYYCFLKGRHSELLYLKIGATAFCAGHLIHIVVLLIYQFIYIGNGGDFFSCGSVASLVMDIFYPCYSLILLFFIFKYANVIVNRHTSIARFGIMHCVGSSLSFWIWTIIRETVNLLNTKTYDNSTEETGSVSAVAEFFDKTFDIGVRLSHSNCDSEVFSSIYSTMSPYLYPFSVEFSILAVGVLVMVYLNVGHCKSCEQPASEEGKEEGHNYLEEAEESNITIHLDCHSSSKGIFFGLITLILTLNTVILFFVVLNDQSLIEIVRKVNTGTELVIISCMTLACILTYQKLNKLDVNASAVNPLDDVLLFICVPAFFLYFLMSIYPMIYYGNELYSTYFFVEIIQVVIQTPLIIDGLRRCSNDRELRKTKPGRELLIFLVIANVAVWMNEAFTYKGGTDERYEFYGTTLWVICGHIALPLKMFYRFHSSVCLVDIWKYAYEPGVIH